MRRSVFALVVALTVAFTATPAGAVTGGQPDNGAHPQVAFILAPGVAFCSGSLIAPEVVLTAGHCTSFFDAQGVKEVLVSFDDQVTADSTFYAARRWRTHPAYVDADWPFTAVHSRRRGGPAPAGGRAADRRAARFGDARRPHP